MPNMDEISKKVHHGLINIYKEFGFDAICKELSQRISDLKKQILTAWFAEHDFEPGKAVLVQEDTTNGFNVYIRESTKDERKRVEKSAIKKTFSCIECADKNSIGSMERWGWKYCPNCGREI